MILHPVIENLKQLRLKGVLEALTMQMVNAESGKLPFEERLALLFEHEIAMRQNRKLQIRLKNAKLKESACMQDVIYEASRKLDKSLILSFESCDWITKYRNILITGATGTGKSYLAQALAHNACLKGFEVLRVQFPKVLHQLTAAKADGSYLKMQTHLAKVDVLLMDDFGIVPFTDEHRRDLWEIIDDRYNKKSTVITSQLPVEDWHDVIGDSTLADAILDRLVHNAYRVALEGESMRKKITTKSNKESCHEKI
jgi:DNA replication protein DnaC